ncbi:MAG: L,D-transpeptidase family protein [Clostridium sp.]|nr:L,D-transpeptidase family protein [Clostridium sp.]
MKKTSKISLVIVLVIFQLFTLSVKGYGKEESDVTYEDVFKLSDENKMSLLEPDLVKFIYKYGLAGILNKKIVTPITIIAKGQEYVLLKNTYANQGMSSTYEEQKDTLEETTVEVVDETERILSLVKDSIVYAEVIEDTNYYQYQGSGLIGTFSKGETVEILRDYSGIWYNVKSEDKTGWVRGTALKIPEDPKTNTHRMTKEETEFFVNYIGLSSDTSYLVWVDIDRQLTHVFLGTKGKWNLHKTMVCATGKNISPTVRGIYKIQDRGTWFYSPRLGGGAKNWVRFSGDYLFHSISMNSNQNIKDDTLGKRVSAGCIRLSIEDSEWFYNYVSYGTTVYVN